MREARITRKTNETKIDLYINLDGSGKCECSCKVGFLEHMLELFAFHAMFDLKIECEGDIHVDAHHTVEDIGIALGEAFFDAIGDKRSIERFGHSVLPMDEALVEVAVDLSGRSYLNYLLDIPTEKIGMFDTELVEEFFMGFVRTSKLTLHMISRFGKNSHHIVEAAFKGVARALRKAVKTDKINNIVVSTKGVC